MSEPESIAVVGIACRLPGARTPEEFMDALCRGVEAVRPEAEWARPDRAPPPRPPMPTRAAGVLEDADRFDAPYFGVTPREAELMDPQQRLFLECCAEALQRAGHDRGDGARIGVYAGAGVNAYFLERVLPDRRIMQENAFQAVASNEKDFLATQVSYRLNLTGPSMTVQTACSTSLVAVSLACESLLAQQCDVALAGGSTVKADPGYGSFLEEGGIVAEDGHCRAFDARASGTVAGSAVGVVALKRLSDALADGDHVHAIIRGTAINNDGARKVGYAAPSVDGQAAVIAEAHAVAGVEPETIGFVEAHGTGTRLGDPIEVAALTRAFGPRAPRGACALGSVKTNVGHADAAAGVVGLIKAVLAVEQARIPPTLHFESPNPGLRLEETPFFVNRETIPWRAAVRRAGVSSFGIGGTNAHVVVESAPPRAPSAPDARPQTLVLSARTATALDAAAAHLADHLERHPDASLADAALTLQTGRRRLAHRRTVACRDREEAVAALRGAKRGAWTTSTDADDLRVAFMFPGQGAQHVGMGRELYETEPTFRRELDRVLDLFRPHLGFDLRSVLYPTPEGKTEAERLLATTLATQPAIFAIELALARLWASWGVRPVALVGHSLGEYVAACVADVLSVEDAVALVAARAKLMHEMPEGAMLSISLAEPLVRALLPDGLSIAGVNAPESCVVSGPTGEVEAFARTLAEKGVDAKRLPVERAFHSAMMDPLLARFEEVVRGLALRPPRIAVVSNLTGKLLTAEEATDPAYWRRHLRNAVRFADGVQHLLAEPGLALLEVGPGRTLASLAARQAPRERLVVASMRHPDDAQATDALVLREALGRLWAAGARIDWSAVHAPIPRRKAILPTYPFERRRYWLEPPAAAAAPDEARVRVRGWRRALSPPRGPPQRWLLVGAPDALAHRLREAGHAAETAQDAEAALARLQGEEGGAVGIALFASGLDALPALAAAAPLTLVARGSQDVLGTESLAAAPLAAHALALGARVVDADPAWDETTLAARVAAELGAPERLVALRGPHRWAAFAEAAPLDGASPGGAWRVMGEPPRALDPVLSLPAHEATPILRVVPDAPDLAQALLREERTLEELRASGVPVTLVTSGGALGGLAVAAALRAGRAGLAWRVVECEDWSRADAADAAAALLVRAPHVLVSPRARESPSAATTYERPDLPVARVAPRSPLEARLVELWEEAFGFRGIGVDDDFFDLGGHSLLASRIVARVQEEFEVDVGLPRFFEARTVADFAGVLEAALLERLDALTEDEARAALRP